MEKTQTYTRTEKIDPAVVCSRLAVNPAVTCDSPAVKHSNIERYGSNEVVFYNGYTGDLEARVSIDSESYNITCYVDDGVDMFECILTLLRDHDGEDTEADSAALMDLYVE